MKSQSLLLPMLEDLHRLQGTNPKKDLITAERRLTHEGESFLSMTLPLLDDQLLTGLTEGQLPRFRGWSTKRHSVLPAFLYSFWSRVFGDDGVLRSNPDHYSVRAIRQISRYHKKVFEVCSDDRVDLAVRRFVDLDASLSREALPDTSGLADIAFYAYGSLSRFVSDRLKPSHGPGAVAERFDSIAKYAFPTVSESVLREFPLDTFRPLYKRMLDAPPEYKEVPARLVAVPKTAVKPRLISIEPSFNQFAQQAMKKELHAMLYRLWNVSNEHQTPNQELARDGSISGQLATVDLSDASDRVRMDLVDRVFARSSRFVRFLRNTRSRYLDVSETETICLHKFASMGSALTFPIEIMVFSCIVMSAILEDEGKRITKSSIAALLRRRDWRVYGDDIVLPSSHVPTLVRMLESYSLKVNGSKSFWKGHFRESCGADWFQGVNVTPVYQRAHIPNRRADVKEIVSLSSFRDQFVDVYGEGSTSAYIDKTVIALIGMYPYVEYPRLSPGITRRGTPVSVRWNRGLQRHEVRAFVPVGINKESTASDVVRLEASLHLVGADGDDVSPVDTNHQWRPWKAKLTSRWIAA